MSWRWTISLFVTFVSVYLGPGILGYFHGQLPDTIRNLVPPQQLQDSIKNFGGTALHIFIEKLTKEDKGLQLRIQKPEDPSENNPGITQIESDSLMENVVDLKKCNKMTEISADKYDDIIEVFSRELNFTEDMTKAMKLAKYTGEYVNSVEKFEQNSDGMYYFATYETKRRPDKTMDIVAVVYGFRWNLVKLKVEKSWSGDETVKQFLQTTTPQQKDLFMKRFRAKAVETFKEICQPNLLKVVDNAIKGQESTGSNEEEDTANEKIFKGFLKFLEENGIRLADIKTMKT